MKLRPRLPRSSSSTTGNERRENIDVDEDDTRGTSDSDFVGNNGEGNDERVLIDLNSLPEDDPEVICLEISDSDSDSDVVVYKPKKKSGLKKRKEFPVPREEVLIPEMVEIIDEEQVHEPVKKNTKRKRKCKKVSSDTTLMWEVWEEELDKWAEESMAQAVDLIDQNEMVSETVDTPLELVMPLLRYQKEWLAWALKQEDSAARGGILADEMGMGKTVQAIALVLAKRKIQRENFEATASLPSSSSSNELPEMKATLVICPLVAVTQWVSEIDRFTLKGSNKILIYHGANREKSIQQFSDFDFVITTYSIIESEYRKNVMPPKLKCLWCGRLLHQQKMSIHLRYFCGPYAKKTANQAKQEKKVSESSDVQTSKSGGKNKGRFKMNHMSINTEKELENESDTEDIKSKKSILHSVKWNRVILDEAHYIKDRRSNTTRAVLALNSSFRWALSGTPLQNRVGELYSLVRFIQIVPYSYYFCKDCDCKTLDYSATDCPNCPHKSVRHFCWWNKYIAKPIQSYGNLDEGRKAMIILRHKVLKSIVLRRTKKGRAADLALPPRIVSLRKDSLDIKEDDYYSSLYNESQAQFNTYISAGTLMNNYAHIFDLLTRLRQAVDHPYLVVYSSTSMERIGNIQAANAGRLCYLCADTVEDPVVTSCAHIFCKSCLIGYSTNLEQVSCPTCSKPLTVDFTATTHTDQTPVTNVKGFRSSSILNRIRLDDFQTSTKIDALREEIRFMVERDGSAKGIVFSQFTSFLDLIHYALQKSGIMCVQLVGSMSMSARDAAISKFTHDPDCRIFLMSLKAGGVALNLTIASHVFLMDPWWNPAVERQAQDRIHRIGQYKPIRVVRFVIENTIEERILKLQEKKELVFEGTVGGSSDALGKLTEEDLKFLFIT
ncbi:DNA repair protein RAD16 [Impatiens glandulifera]|uniref:DNA repair protein RAD16 n=1 Tax=Impatiens glandulifera TaxID=253017 RepID=UPI001FB0C8AD|nr:DNA repair protein RAD16 [Impatiens glandulifera]